MEEETTLRDEIRNLGRKLENKKIEEEKHKKFKFPRVAKLTQKKSKEGYASVCFINENRDVKFLKLPIKEGSVIYNGSPYIASTDYMLNYKNKPFLIIPTWDIAPFSPQKQYDDAFEQKRLNVGYRLVLNTLKSEQIKPKASFGSAWIWIAVIALVGAGAYYLYQRGGL
ncbi:hypothetical protein M0R04_14545 [Candidatus Dojkabacteria bacterium]|jgi:hypothetical protein|nr:hypothetical protein [Candidatus Dojkabacteria bacterium]